MLYYVYFSILYAIHESYQGIISPLEEGTEVLSAAKVY